MALNFPPQSIGGSLPSVGTEWYDTSSDTTWEVIDQVNDGLNTVAVWQIKVAGGGINNFGGPIDITDTPPNPLPDAGVYYVVQDPGGTANAGFGNLGGESFTGGEAIVYTGDSSDPWIQINSASIPEATTSQAGIVQLADSADMLANNTTNAVTPNLINGISGSGNIGYWSRSGTDLSPVNSGDSLDDVGSITAAGNFSFTAADSRRINAKETLQVNVNSDGGKSNRAFQVLDNGVPLFSVNESNAELYETGLTAAGDIKIGGTSAAPNITLGADGNGYIGGGFTVNGASTFKNQVVLEQNLVIDGPITAYGLAQFKDDVAVGDSSATFTTFAAVIAALPEGIRTRFADALSAWETAGTLDLEDPTTLPADDELREAIIRATTAGKINLNSFGGTVFDAEVLSKNRFQVNRTSGSDIALDVYLNDVSKFSVSAGGGVTAAGTGIFGGNADDSKAFPGT